MTLPEMIAVMHAADKGARIERKQCGNKDSSWRYIEYPSWDWSAYEYRVEQPKEPVTYTGEELISHGIHWVRKSGESVAYSVLKVEHDFIMVYNNGTISIKTLADMQWQWGDYYGEFKSFVNG